MPAEAALLNSGLDSFHFHFQASSELEQSLLWGSCPERPPQAWPKSPRPSGWPGRRADATPSAASAPSRALPQNTAPCPLSGEAGLAGGSLPGGLQWGMGIWPPGKLGEQSFRAGLPMQDRQVPAGLCPIQLWGGKHEGLRGRGQQAPAATAALPKSKGSNASHCFGARRSWRGRSCPSSAMGKALPRHERTLRRGKGLGLQPGDTGLPKSTVGSPGLPDGRLAPSLQCGLCMALGGDCPLQSGHSLSSSVENSPCEPHALPVPDLQDTLQLLAEAGGGRAEYHRLQHGVHGVQGLQGGQRVVAVFRRSLSPAGEGSELPVQGEETHAAWRCPGETSRQTSCCGQRSLRHWMRPGPREGGEE